MPATTSRLPQDVPLPESPVKPVKVGSSKKKGKKDVGPAKETTSTPVTVVDGTTPWAWTSLTDESASKYPPLFTKDSAYFFSIVGSSVKIHSVQTGLVVSTLTAPSSAKAPGVSDLITSAILNPNNPFQLITASLNGRIVVWDFLDAALLQTIDIEQPIFHLCAHEKFKDCVFVAASRPTNKKNHVNQSDDNAVVLRVSLKASAATAQLPVQKSTEVYPVGKTRTTEGLAFSPSGAWLVAIAGHKAYVVLTSSFKSGFTKYVSPERLTCLAFHPSEEYFATGDEKGNIRLWYCLNEETAVSSAGVEKKSQTTTLHWHAHAVSSIAFTDNGAYLLSGGQESVLVAWQLHTGKKEFVPRVGSAIKTVSVLRAGEQEEEYLLGLADATFVFVNAGSLKISRTFSRIKLDPTGNDPSLPAPTSAPLAVHSLTSTLMLPSSHPSSLQTYAPASAKLIAELEVSPSNRVSRRDEKAIVPSRVERSVISTSSEWMATVDSREGDDTFRGEIYLKMWWWDRKASAWVLNTRIDRPHGLHTVTSISFSPVKDSDALHLVTTGKDGNVKTWRIRSVKDKKGGTEEFWATRSSMNFRSEIPQHASWSPDGSLLAISSGPYVALYDPVTNILRQTLTSPESKNVASAHFVGKGGRYLAVVGLNDVVLWDLVTETIRWQHKTSAPIQNVIPHPTEDTFALFQQLSTAHPTNVTIFRCSSAAPTKEHSLPFGLLNAEWYSVPSSFSSGVSSFNLVGITTIWSVVLFGDEVRLPEEEGSTAKEITGVASQKRTIFQDIFGKSAFPDISTISPPQPPTGNALPWTGKEASTIFDGPAYLMPPLDSLFEPLMGGFLRQRSEDDTETNMEGKEDLKAEDEDAMDVDDDPKKPFVVGVAPKRIVDQAEMEGFIALFKQHSMKAQPLTNGIKKTNGHPPKTNGLTPRVKQVQTPAKVTPHPTPAAKVAETPTPTGGIGKKRKKSL